MKFFPSHRRFLRILIVKLESLKLGELFDEIQPKYHFYSVPNKNFPIQRIEKYIKHVER